ncbi:D-glycero-beta-D-manno-heptose-7-phosphate kinase [Helicobacter cholecystus]|uniref:D-glycero-beta-D-manno-heptose-7-phosphate kinase n=1 Tax=Helicobacter cholecystus TaxID=45498 RepID=UPI0027388DE4|nr:D-glycero-beta-D-manno-heptose-7-phosphate kinase [Helicobacter cholecystus]
MLDHYILGDCSRISPEAPVQVVEVTKEQNRLGGACNVAHNLIALGAKVELCGVIGEDKAGEMLLQDAKNLGIGVKHIYKDKKRQTTQKSRILVSNQQILRVDRENKDDLCDEILQSLYHGVCSEITECDGLILSDYGKGVLSKSMCKKLISLANEYQKVVLCDPKGSDYSKYKYATLLTPNKKEAKEATGIEINNKENLLLALNTLKEQCNLLYPLITLSEDGIGILEDGELKIFPTLAQEVYDVTGAGDTVIASLGYMLAQGQNIKEAVKFANSAAAVVVAKVGSAVATQEEIGRFHHQEYAHSKILTCAKQLPQNPNIVFTNGCFDILHKGHVSYLQKAKKLGDILVVGLNSDSSVRALKGENRPINSQEDRAFLLASLECVDYVIIFDELTPYELIKSISPKILVKGADYKGKEVVGSEFAQEVKLIDFVEGKSTTNLIKKIKG